MSESIDPFFSSEFDNWAETYDASVSNAQFPFQGYQEVLAKIVTLAAPHPGLSVLDLGTGTGNLASRITTPGCELWCTDFSAPMLEKARKKLPSAHFVLHDLRTGWPAELNRPFDRIISAYVFHHFELDEKIRIVRSLFSEHLVPGGLLILGDICFPDRKTMERVKNNAGDGWEGEFYWIASETIEAFRKIDLPLEYEQVSYCAGIFTLYS
jgi:putative AdoMet-dependent methyltransferase